MFLTSDLLKVRHGFFTRRGGVSDGLFSSLNCGLYRGDDPEKVQENRRRALQALNAGASQLHILKQMHTATVITLTDNKPLPDDLLGDALVTARTDIALGVVTADCAPVLFHDPQAGVIGAAHSGWKGTLENISAATLDAMEKLGANRRHIQAVIGPCIAAGSYEVGPDFPTPFLAADAALARFFAPSAKEGHFMFDLPGSVKYRLEQAGIGNVTATGHDTYKESDNFFSNRRATHKGEGGFGLQLSAICRV